MQSSPSPTLIEQARRNAKRMAKQADIPLHQAQDQIAQSKGFANWSLFAKRPAIAAPAASREHPRPYRFYLHGDQHETQDAPVTYYCAECDLFMTPDHFNTPHRQEHGQRALSAIERFQRSPTDYTSRGHRPKNPPNLVQPAIDEAIRMRQAVEAARSPFHRWIEQQTQRNDPVGDLASDIMSDKRFPTDSNSYRVVSRHLTYQGASREAIDCLKDAWREFSLLGPSDGLTK